MEEWLQLIPGKRCLPLTYLIHMDLALPDNDDPAESYPSIIDEMIHCALIGTMNPDGTVTYHPMFASTTVFVSTSWPHGPMITLAGCILNLLPSLTLAARLGWPCLIITLA